MEGFVYIDDYGLKGSNFYWQNRERYNLSEEELKSAGITDNRVRVHKDIINPLAAAAEDFNKRGCLMLVKEGYRSVELYHLVHRKRRERYGEDNVNQLLNTKNMPHATGKAVDIGLADLNTGQEILTRNPENNHESLFVDYYKSKTDEKSKNYQALQERMREVMLKHGFKLGKLKEYFHFGYDR